MFSFSGLIIGKMTDNQDRLRHYRVFQHASVCKEGAKLARPLVGSSSFDAEASTSRVQVSPSSSSWRRVSPANAPKAVPVHGDALVVDAAIPEVFGEDPYDTSLMSLYANHAARNV